MQIPQKRELPRGECDSAFRMSHTLEKNKGNTICTNRHLVKPVVRDRQANQILDIH
jgi:hypothetical protein